MSWTCPNQTKDDYCELRKKKCEPSSAECLLSSKFKFIELDEDKPKLDRTKGKRNKKRGR